MMTFIEKIYMQIKQVAEITTDQFSIDWLKQSRSYYSSLKAQNREVSIGVLQELLLVVSTRQQAAFALSKERGSERLKSLANIYHSLVMQIASEIARRSLESTKSNKQVGISRKLVLEALSRRISEELYSDEQHDGFAPVVMV